MRWSSKAVAELVPPIAVEDDVSSADGLAVRHGGAKPTALTVRAIESLDKDRSGIDLRLFLKPLRVGQVEPERERFDIGRRPALDLQELLNGMDPKGVQLHIAARAQVHALGHVDFPEVHRLPNDHVVDAEMAGVGRHGQTIRSCPDDQQICRVVHAPELSMSTLVLLTSG